MFVSELMALPEGGGNRLCLGPRLVSCLAVLWQGPRPGPRSPRHRAKQRSRGAADARHVSGPMVEALL